MEQEIAIREATPEDFTHIARIALEAFPVRNSCSAIRDIEQARARIKAYYEQLAQRGISYWPASLEVSAFVAVNGRGEQLGYLILATQTKDELTGEPQAWVIDMAVQRGYWGRGIGRKLLQQAEVTALSKGLHYLSLKVASGNRRAIALYERLGYVEEWKLLAKKLS